MSMNEVYKEFLNKKVDVGIPHLYKEGKLFFLTGFVFDVKDGALFLKIKDGFRKIPFDDIIEIRPSESEY